jgi:thiol-disulfide isomerase/thioredoxin
VYKNGKLLTVMVSPKQNRYVEKRIHELKPEELIVTTQGQLTDWIHILNDQNAEQLPDTLINKTVCYHIKTIKNGLPHSLFIAKKSLMPMMLRITTNTFQPFIEEYSYSNFNYSTVLNYSELSKMSIQTTSEKAIVKENDILPDWELADLKGNNYSLKKPEKYKIIYLSMINCGPCQEAIPYVEKMYNEYNQTDSVEFVVFYPVDDKESLIRYVQRKNLKPNLVYNSSAKQEKKIEILSYLNIGYPAFLIVDKENRIRHIIGGFNKNIEIRVKSRLDKVVKDESSNL